MVLQLAIGPVCLLVFKASTMQGFASGMQVTLAVSIVDTVFIILSLLGISYIINKSRILQFLKKLSGVTLIIVGINCIINIINFSPINNINHFNYLLNNNFFLTGIILTISNPLTLLFWSSIFSKKVAENNYNKVNLVFLQLVVFVLHFSFYFLSHY